MDYEGLSPEYVKKLKASTRRLQRRVKAIRAEEVTKAERDATHEELRRSYWSDDDTVKIIK